MFERATDDIIALATVAAAAVVAVVAAGFAIYAGVVQFGASPAIAAMVVSVVAACVVGVFALLANARSRAKERAAAEAQAEMARQLPLNIGDLARDHPIAALVTSLVGGALAARHPKLARDLLSLVARVGVRR